MKRYTTGLLVIGLVTAIATPAFAFSWNNVPSAGAPLKFKFQNWDSGRTYVPLPGTFTALGDSATLSGAKLANVKAGTDAAFTSFPGPAAGAHDATEDAWGLFQLTQILADNNKDGLFESGAWNFADPSPDVLGMFYGISDVEVTLTLASLGVDGVADTGDDILTIEVDAVGDIRFDLYELPDGSLPIDAATARTGQAAYPAITVGPKWLTGAAVPLNASDPAGIKFSSTFALRRDGVIVDDAQAGIDATASMLFDLDGGTAQKLFDTGDRFDLDFATNVNPNVTDFGPFEDWTALTDDPALGRYVIPEPLTMGAFGLAFAGLGGYIKKRNRKA